MAKIVCIVQARRGSSRLPEKILRPLAGEPALAHVLRRCAAIPSIDEVVCAGVASPFEEPIFEIAGSVGASVFKGDEQDVLSRYFGAAAEAQADWVMRVTSDCPLFSPDAAELLIENTLGAGADYGALEGWPHGLDCELFTMSLLKEAHETATLPLEREHVTLWMKSNSQIKRVHVRPPDGGFYASQYRWVLDYPEDYEFLSAIYDRLGPDVTSMDWKAMMNFLDENPDLKAINADCTEKWRQEALKMRDTLGTDYLAKASTAEIKGVPGKPSGDA